MSIPTLTWFIQDEDKLNLKGKLTTPFLNRTGRMTVFYRGCIQHIYHIPKVLYHSRMHSGSAALTRDTTSKAGQTAIKEALQRREEPGEVETLTEFRSGFHVRYKLQAQRKSVGAVGAKLFLSRWHSSECRRSSWPGGYTSCRTCVSRISSRPWRLLRKFGCYKQFFSVNCCLFDV